MAKKKSTTATTAVPPVAAPTPAVVPAPAAAAALTTSSSPPPKPSFRDLDPLEHGGTVARKGFVYQDHVAAGKCLDMLQPDGPCEVWCEAEDDIVLVWVEGGVEVFEFVQVKSNELDQLWSVSKLCHREPSSNGQGVGHCIVEKSLAHDRGREPCRFRIVTCREPNSDMAVLRLAVGNAARSKPDSGLTELVASIGGYVTAFTSLNGNGVEFWVRNTVWEHRASIRDAENDNLCKLDRILHQENVYLAPDQKRELYATLVQKVCDASTASAKTNAAAKKLTVGVFRTWLIERAGLLARPATAGRSDDLVVKLKKAGFDPDGDEVKAAKEQRQTFRQSVLQPKFLDLDDHQVLETEVQATLAGLKARLDAGELQDSGLEFHSRCLKALEGLRADLPTKQKPLLGLLYGCMYDVMNRCSHRLVRASV